MDSFSSFLPLRKDLAIITCLVAIALGVLLATRRGQKRHGVSLPPGPKGKWLVGNAFEFPRLHSWNKFTEWRDQYGK